MTRREAISQVKRILNAVNADARYTNKFIWSVIHKHMRWLINRSDNKMQLMKNNSLFQTLKCVDVEEAPVIDDCCGVRSRCTIYRTKNKIPKVYEPISGLLIKSVFSIDGSTEFQPISVQDYIRKLENPNSKYVKGNYYYHNNGYLYFPANRIKKIMIKAFFEDDITNLNECEDREETCQTKMDMKLNVPDDIFGEMMSHVLRDLIPTRQIPDDNQIDKNTIRLGQQ